MAKDGAEAFLKCRIALHEPQNPACETEGPRTIVFMCTANADEPRVSKQMNWKSGLLRLWIFVSFLWLAWAGSMSVLDGGWPEPQVLLLIIGAPVLLLALGAGTFWIVRGFGPIFGKTQTTAPATSHQYFRWRRTFIVFILMVATMATTIAVYEINNSYENCILRNMPGAPPNAVALIRQSCRSIAW